MPSRSTIVQVTARQVYSERGHPGVEARVATAGGAAGVALCTAGASVGKHEVAFVHDGGERWDGLGVQDAVDNVNRLIAPALQGMDAADQAAIDDALLNVGGPGAKARLGGNATAAVSAAVLKAGAASLQIPLYRHIGGVNACVLPVPGVLGLLGSRRYGGGSRSGGKPSYSFICHGFDTFSEASYAAWRVYRVWERLLASTFDLEPLFKGYPTVPIGSVEHDRQLWELMVAAIHKAGYDGRVGLQVDVAAGTYLDEHRQRFVGLFSQEDKDRQALMELYSQMVRDYPFVIIEDPLGEEDYEGHAWLTEHLGIEVVGDDLFTTNVERLQHGLEMQAANALLLKVNQIGTISEAFGVARLALQNGMGVMPCSSRGEGPDIADYAVGLNTGHLREGGTGPIANRLLQIEAELGHRAVFPGRAGLKP